MQIKIILPKQLQRFNDKIFVAASPQILLEPILLAVSADPALASREDPCSSCSF
jgi:hypothetical protein